MTSNKRQLLVTAALPYANGPLHLGHMVGYIQADIWVRFQKMLGNTCIFICGSDGHGTPIMIQAEKLKLSPEVLIETIFDSNKTDFAGFHVGFDDYYKTHSKENQELVELIFKRHQAAGNISKHTIKQLYDPQKDMFLPDRYIKGECPNCHAKDQYGDNCEVCGATYLPTDVINPVSVLSGAVPIIKESEHYFFKLQNYKTFLESWTNGDHLQLQVTNKLAEWFQEGLREWDISRDAPYFGFKIPGETNKYFYVWLDAPVGYMASFKHYCDQTNLNFDDYWRPDSTIELHHFIGKDIIYFHALFWPAILKGAQFRTPTRIFVNGFLTINGQKMSKSRGTFIKASTYLKHFKSNDLRYYFAAKLNERIEDIDLNFDDFINRINSDLIGKFVNIASRSASFLEKYFNHTLSEECSEPELFEAFSKAGDDIAEKYNQMAFSRAIRDIMNLADRANQYIDEKKPWMSIKDPARKNEVQAICSMGINLFRLLMIYLKPVLPEAALDAEKFLSVPPLKWSDKNTPLCNHRLSPFKPFLTRIDPKQIEEMMMTADETKIENNALQTNKDNQTISIDDFNKIDLRVGKIKEAESVENADKLLKLIVEMGEETRQIFAGIKSAYQPDELIGRHVVVVANLAPRKMRFGMSEGMVLAASGNDKAIWLISPDPGAESGSKVK